MSQRSPMTEAQLRELRQRAGADYILTDPAECYTYGIDNSANEAQPEAVVFGHSSEQIQAVVQFCYEHYLPLIARGRGTGTTGACVPVQGGIILSTERMTDILEVDAQNRLMRTQPGVTNQAVQEAAGKAGFFWPPDPSSAAYCTVGGNLANNAAGPRAVKYGTPRENTLALTAVTGKAEIITTGVRTTKGVVGYDLTRLLIGSEGTLAIITEATLKLTPLPESKRTLQAFYTDMHGAARAVSRLMAQAITPCALEFIDQTALQLVAQQDSALVPAGAGGMLMIEVDGPRDCLQAAESAIQAAANDHTLLEIRSARDDVEAQRLWSVRKTLSQALRRIAPRKINEDVVVPVSRIPDLIDRLASLSEKYAIPIVNFGHAGNGNIHVNLLVDPEDPRQQANAEPCLSEVFDCVLQFGGTLSGEHGVGLEKRPYVARELGEAELQLMRAIKAQFDPHGIMNPDKKIP